MAKKLHNHLHDHLIPHKGNNFKPFLFTAGGVAALIALILLIQLAYVVQTKLVFQKTDFLASVLPGVLATLTNEDRAAAGVSPLTQDEHLARAAQMKADDMAARGYFAHVDPEGRQPWYWFDKTGYDYTYAGENLAVNFSDSEDVEKAWMNSPTHRANIEKGQYTRVGFGVAQGMYQGKETTFVVQFFATPRATAAYQVATADTAPEASTASVTEPTEPATSVQEDVVAAVVSDSSEESSVLGAELGTSVSDNSSDEEANEGEESALARVEGATSDTLSFFAQVAASPTHTVIYALAGLAAVVAVLLLVALAAHVRVQYLEVAGGGFLVLMVALSLLVFNATTATSVIVPDGSEPASVMVAF